MDLSLDIYVIFLVSVWSARLLLRRVTRFIGLWFLVEYSPLCRYKQIGTGTYSEAKTVAYPGYVKCNTNTKFYIYNS